MHASFMTLIWTQSSPGATVRNLLCCLERLDESGQDNRKAVRSTASMIRSEGGRPRQLRSCGGLAPWQIGKVERYIADHLDSRLTVALLAQQISSSVSHFCRCFKESFGLTPHDYVVRLRMERARTFLSTTDASLSEIALRCGLADQAHLSKLFRRWNGEPPNTWRRRNAAAAADGKVRRSA